MKVLVIPGWYPGKYTAQNGNFYVEQVKYLYEAGVEIAVIALDLDYRYYLHFDGFLRKRTFTIENGIPTFRISGGGFPKKNKWLLDQWAKKMISLYDDYVKKFGQPDIIHAHNFWGGYVAKKLFDKEKIPYIFSEVFSGILSDEWPEWQKPLYNSICVNACNVIAISHALAEKIKHLFTLKKCMVIPFFIDTELFSIKQKTWNQEKIRFIGVGSLIPLKRFDMQLQAVNHLIAKGLDVSLTIIGKGPDEQKLKNMARSLQITDKVNFVPEVPYHLVAEKMQQSDIFLLTSDVETFGIVVIEAMSVGLPVIATDCAGPKDIITEETGRLIQTGDVKALAEEMERMIVQYDTYDKNRIRAYAKMNYSKEAVCQQIIDIYNKVIDSKYL